MKELKLDTKENTEVEVKEKSVFREIVEWIICILAAFTAAMLVRYFIFTPTLVCQKSMEPTILDGEKVLINRLVRTFKLPLYRGDIVTFEEPASTDSQGRANYNQVNGAVDFFFHDVLEVTKRSYIKRVIGTAGDYVKITSDGCVYVNDEKMSEPYLNGISTPITGPYCEIEVPDGYVFVMGDHRDASSDSREFGCVPVEKIEGRVTTRIWPLSAFGKIDK